MKRQMCGCLGDHCTHDELLCHCLGCQLRDIEDFTQPTSGPEGDA